MERGTGGDEEGRDNLGFVSMMIAFMAIILLVLGILFVVGLIFLGIGIVTKKNPKNIPLNKGEVHKLLQPL